MANERKVIEIEIIGMDNLNQAEEKIKKIDIAAKALDPVFKSASKSLTDAFNSSIMEKTMSPWVSGIESLSEHAGAVGPIMVGMSAGIQVAKLAMDGFNLACLANPLTWIVGGLVAVVGAWGMAVADAEQKQQEYADSVNSVFDSMNTFQDGVSNAKGILNGFSMEAIASRESMNQIDQGVTEAREGILTIAEEAYSTGQALSEGQKEQIEGMMTSILDFNDQKIQAYQDQQQVVLALAAQEEEMTVESAQNIMRSAEDTYQQTIGFAYDKYVEQVALAEQTYGHLGELDKEAYDTAIEEAKGAYDQQLEEAQGYHRDTLDLVQSSYYDQHVAGDENTKRMGEIYKELEDARKEHDDQIAEYDRMSLANDWDYTQEKSGVVDTLEETERALYEELQSIMESGVSDTMGSWMAMAQTTELYGGQVCDEGQNVIDAYLDIFDDLPEDLKEKGVESFQGFYDGLKEKEPDLMKQAESASDSVIKKVKETLGIASPSKVMKGFGENTMEGLKQGLEAKEADVYNKASEIAEGVLSRVKKAFDINSPSKKMKKLFEYVMEGAVVGIDEQEDTLLNQVDSIGDEVLSHFEDSLDLEQSIANMRSGFDISTRRFGNSVLTGSSYANSRSNIQNNQRSLVIENVNWNNKQDIRETMEQMGFMSRREARRLG